MTNIILFFYVNRRKRGEGEGVSSTCAAGVASAAAGVAEKEVTWVQRRNAYWALMSALFTLAVGLDQLFAISPWLVGVKAYVCAFPVGLLDLHYSKTRGVSPRVLLGAALWCSTVYVRGSLISACFGHDVPVTVVGKGPARWAPDARGIGAADADWNFFQQEFDILLAAGVLAREFVRFSALMAFSGIYADLLFSPMHRTLHHARLYKHLHKTHHEFSNELTSLVLYHGELLDDFLMPVTTSFGGCLHAVLAGWVGSLLGIAHLESQAFANVNEYLIVMATLLSHAHDTRCARLLAPMPDELNFVAYHYVHHLAPGCNFGLTEPSDLVWDRLLGVNTIRKLADFEKRRLRENDGVEQEASKLD